MRLVYRRVGPRQSSLYINTSEFARPYTLAHLFRKLRTARDVSKRALAVKCSVSEGYVSRVESGSRFPSVRYCLSCAEEFGVNPEWVKRAWVREMVLLFQSRLNKRLEIED